MNYVLLKYKKLDIFIHNEPSNFLQLLNMLIKGKTVEGYERNNKKYK